MKRYLYLPTLALVAVMTLISSLEASGPTGSFTPSTKFESGAADSIHVRPDGTVAFSIPPDPGGPEYLWFYFTLAGGVKKGQAFALENAADAHQTGDRWNLTRPVFSADGKTWVRAGEVDYSREFSLRHPLGQPVFHFKSPIAAETLRVAYCYPYTSADLNAFMETFKGKLHDIGSIGKSEEGRDIVHFQVGDSLSEGEHKPEIWIICREHPGETPASFVLEGMVNALLNDPSGKHLCDAYTFQFVPMFNVDGVAHGYYYHNAKGINVARDWAGFQSLEVRELRALMFKGEHLNPMALSSTMRPDFEKNNKLVQLVIDLHSSNDPSLGHFFLEMPSATIYPIFARFQQNVFDAVEHNFPQLQARSTVRLQDLPGITGNGIYRDYHVYTLYLESNYSRGADGTPVTPESLRETGKALVQALDEVMRGEE